MIQMDRGLMRVYHTMNAADSLIEQIEHAITNGASWDPLQKHLRAAQAELRKARTAAYRSMEMKPAGATTGDSSHG